jgi:NAD(P)-dependent dehydrogenase (short-subunit alcohol dehydrogenase family)
LLIFNGTHNQDIWQRDVLINNAGIRGAQKSVHELTSDEWDYVIDVNLKAALCTREAIRRMTCDGKSARKTIQLSISPQYMNPFPNRSQHLIPHQKKVWKC